MVRRVPFTLPLRCLWKYTILVICLLSLLLLIDSQWQKLLYSENLDNQVNNHDSVNKKFTILIWKHGTRMLRRFLRSYGTEEKDPFEHCSVRNCQVRINDEALNSSDAVMFHLHQTAGPSTLPKYHSPNQIWIFFTDESPYHTFLLTRKYSMKDYNGYFNWSMTYRSDSDVPTPYGRTVELSSEERKAIKTLPNYFQINERLVAILGSNCGGRNRRWKYVRELQKHISVDIYGGCGPLKCPGHFTKDCTPLKDYKFYLSFENSNCKEYITEKLWWNAYNKNTVPVIMGAPKKDYIKLCPPNSFIHVDDFSSPADLAKFLLQLASKETEYNSYFEWKKKYKVLNEHGYFGSPSLHLCRICETLNDKNKPTKVYDKLEEFWNSATDCTGPSWVPL